MRINRHEFAGGVGSRCLVCGSVRRDDSEAGTPLGCIDREVRPEPQRRRIACEDADAISRRIAEIKADKVPRCPLFAERKLYDCLRSSSRCGEPCPLKNDWIGPETAAEASHDPA